MKTCEDRFFEKVMFTGRGGTGMYKPAENCDCGDTRCLICGGRGWSYPKCVHCGRSMMCREGVAHHKCSMKAQVERDRYRKALEEIKVIVSKVNHPALLAPYDAIYHIATEALESIVSPVTQELPCPNEEE